jgi:glycosidase
VFTLAFKDADTGSDFNAGLGDFVGVRESFGEIKEMGMNAIWPTPVLKTEKNSKRPDTVEKLEIDDEMGGDAKFTELVKSAHAKDLKVIVDVPLTVTSKGNWAKDIKDGIAKEGDDKSQLGKFFSVKNNF